MDQIKKHLFADGDLGITQASIRNTILQEGQQSKLLLQNKILTQVVSEMYLSLVKTEDELDIASPLVEGLRLQRRLLRQILAALDNKVHCYEQLEEQLLIEKQEEKLNENDL